MDGSPEEDESRSAEEDESRTEEVGMKRLVFFSYNRQAISHVHRGTEVYVTR